MDIETAANVGEAVSGIAILFTLLFSLRQMKHWNENRRYEIGRDLAAHMNNPLVHRGFSVSTVKLHDELTPQELAALTREEKDAMNALDDRYEQHRCACEKRPPFHRFGRRLLWSLRPHVCQPLAARDSHFHDGQREQIR